MRACLVRIILNLRTSPDTCNDSPPLFPNAFPPPCLQTTMRGRGASRKGGRGGARILSNPSVHQIKGATLSLNSAISEYGVTRADLESVPCSWRSCHGNSYALLQRSDVEAVVAQKKASDPAYAHAASAKQSSKELASARATLAEAASKLDEIEARNSNGGYLGLTGVNPNVAARLPKTDSKRLYCLDDADLRGLSVTYGRGMMGNASENYLPEELLRAAEAKHGGASGFLERRRKQQQRTSKKEIDEWKAKKASAQAAVARLAPPTSLGGGGGAGAAASSSAPIFTATAPHSSAGAGKAKAKTPASSKSTSVSAGKKRARVEVEDDANEEQEEEAEEEGEEEEAELRHVAAKTTTKSFSATLRRVGGSLGVALDADNEITAVHAEGAGAIAGLQVGDIVTEVNGKVTHMASTFGSLLPQDKAQPVKLRLKRFVKVEPQPGVQQPEAQDA